MKVQDICYNCGVAQEYGTMRDVNENDFDIFCDDCHPSKDVKTYKFAVPCSMIYHIDAPSEKEAREILQKNGGHDIKGELLIDNMDYLDAYLDDD